MNEYAKILSGSTGGGGVTEGARHEAEAMLPLDATPAQIAPATATTLELVSLTAAPLPRAGGLAVLPLSTASVANTSCAPTAQATCCE